MVYSIRAQNIYGYFEIMEYNLNGRWPQRKTTLLEDNIHSLKVTGNEQNLQSKICRSTLVEVKITWNLLVYSSRAKHDFEISEIHWRNLYERLAHLKMTQIGGIEQNLIFNNLGFTRIELKTISEPPAWTIT